MKTKFGIQLITTFIIATGTLFAQSVTTVPTDTGNDRFLEEYHSSIIRPGLSLNGFDNFENYYSVTIHNGEGLKQVLNAALSGNTYIKSKLNKIFALVPLLCCGMSDRGSASNYKHYEDTKLHQNICKNPSHWLEKRFQNP